MELNTAMTPDLRYPIGEFDRNFEISADARRERIKTLIELPDKLAAAVAGLNDEQLDTEYRPGGWTVRQTAHHVPDSHSNALIRFKWALTEDSPVIKAYYEDRWAMLGDSKMPVDVSLRLIRAVHERWVALLESMSEDDYQRTFHHPETGEWTLDGVLALYAWHSRHHTAHITSLRERMGW
jgi:uncharacterized damage-inducible protein DinB